MFEEKYSRWYAQGYSSWRRLVPGQRRVGWWKNGYPEYARYQRGRFYQGDAKLDGESVDLAKDEFSDFELALDMKSGILTRKLCCQTRRKEGQIKLLNALSALTWRSFMQIASRLKKPSSASVEVEIESAIDADVFNVKTQIMIEKFWKCLKKKSWIRQQVVCCRNDRKQFRHSAIYMTEMLMENVSDLDVKEPVETEPVAVNVFSGTLESGKKTVFEKRVVVLTFVTTKRLKIWMVPEKRSASRTALTNWRQHRQTVGQSVGKSWRCRWRKRWIATRHSFQLVPVILDLLWKRRALEHRTKRLYLVKNTAVLLLGYWRLCRSFVFGIGRSISDAQLAWISSRTARYTTTPARIGRYCSCRWRSTESNATTNGKLLLEEIHPNGTIAYAIYNYTRYTWRYVEYVTHDGFDALVGIARFWADRVHFSKRKGMYMIHGVTGPNEYENNHNLFSPNSQPNWK